MVNKLLNEISHNCLVFENKLSQWISDGSESLHLKLVQPFEPLGNDNTFHPVFTYPVFGEEEKIFGYKDLVIRVCISQISHIEKAILRSGLLDHVSWHFVFIEIGPNRDDTYPGADYSSRKCTCEIIR